MLVDQLFNEFLHNGVESLEADFELTLEELSLKIVNLLGLSLLGGFIFDLFFFLISVVLVVVALGQVSSELNVGEEASGIGEELSLGSSLDELLSEFFKNVV